ncbi:MAG TPA: hypothetical protein VE422_06605 [Terriglobia bacterium]|nr:hypothetical protein [Terriglobia bacterium]
MSNGVTANLPEALFFEGQWCDSGIMINGNLLKEQWYERMNDLRERWPDLTQSDVVYIEGDANRLIEVVQKRRHIPREEAIRDVNDFIDHLKVRLKLA